jgi:uncharacterized membrane protein
MKIQVGKLWNSLRSSYWFVPSLLALGAILLALILIQVDRKIQAEQVEKLNWLYTGGPDGARSLLSTVAGSTISVAGTVFSITMVALSLASSQLGPRLLRNFMQDTGNQVVLGTFTATFIYCLLVLRAIRGEEYAEIFVPEIAVTVGIILALASIGVLIYFIHHVAASIQADQVVARIGQDLKQAIDRLFPKAIGQESDQDDPSQDVPGDFEQYAQPVFGNQGGYLQAIDDAQLIKLAQAHQVLIKIHYHPGSFVIVGSALVSVYPGNVKKQLAQAINEAFVCGSQRTQQQDIEFFVNQLVEIALRALSPGINDPFTAIRCIDQLSEALCYVVQRRFPSAYRYDDQHRLRVIARSLTFDELVDIAFNQIRQNARSSVAVRMRLLEAIDQIAQRTHNSEHKEQLLVHAQMIHRSNQAEIFEERDRAQLETRYLNTLKALKV